MERGLGEGQARLPLHPSPRSASLSRPLPQGERGFSRENGPIRRMMLRRPKTDLSARSQTQLMTTPAGEVLRGLPSHQMDARASSDRADTISVPHRATTKDVARCSIRPKSCLEALHRNDPQCESTGLQAVRCPQLRASLGRGSMGRLPSTACAPLNSRSLPVRTPIQVEAGRCLVRTQRAKVLRRGLQCDCSTEGAVQTVGADPNTQTCLLDVLERPPSSSRYPIAPFT